MSKKTKDAEYREFLANLLQITIGKDLAGQLENKIKPKDGKEYTVFFKTVAALVHNPELAQQVIAAWKTANEEMVG
ncbi:hypothetical protein FACS18942_05720 [Planctomycetales bacterium]|nr:hypothetical protein FACS18942_05720 [Planctomycetales bacterium]